MSFVCNRLSGNASIARASQNNPPLKQGAQGEGVRILQMALIDLGFAMPGSTRKNTALPDGIFGPETTRVVIAFQRLNGLKPDAIVGTQTLARLDLLLDAKSRAVAEFDRARGNRGTGRS